MDGEEIQPKEFVSTITPVDDCNFIRSSQCQPSKAFFTSQTSFVTVHDAGSVRSEQQHKTGRLNRYRCSCRLQCLCSAQSFFHSTIIWGLWTPLNIHRNLSTNSYCEIVNSQKLKPLQPTGDSPTWTEESNRVFKSPWQLLCRDSIDKPHMRFTTLMKIARNGSRRCCLYYQSPVGVRKRFKRELFIVWFQQIKSKRVLNTWTRQMLNRRGALHHSGWWCCN